MKPFKKAENEAVEPQNAMQEKHPMQLAFEKNLILQ